MYTFCTYFDHNYLSRGLALYRSLERRCQAFHLWILCQSRACLEALARLDLPHVTLISQEQFKQDDEELRHAEKNRTRIEYYFTCTPSLLLYVFRRSPGANLVAYLDADLFFFSDPAPIFEEQATGSIAIIEHRFPPRLRHLTNHGIYNVGWLSFRRNDMAMACLTWWRERCLEWCHDRVEDGKFADQGYLNEWPARFPGTVVLQHKGANLAPWNVGRYTLRQNDGKVFVDEDELVFFHFHNLKRVCSFAYDTCLSQYGFRLTRILRNAVYMPYVRMLQGLEASGWAAESIRHHQLPFGPVRWARKAKRLARSALRVVVGGQVILRRCVSDSSVWMAPSGATGCPSD